MSLGDFQTVSRGGLPPLHLSESVFSPLLVSDLAWNLGHQAVARAPGSTARHSARASAAHTGAAVHRWRPAEQDAALRNADPGMRSPPVPSFPLFSLNVTRRTSPSYSHLSPAPHYCPLTERTGPRLRPWENLMTPVCRFNALWSPIYVKWC